MIATTILTHPFQVLLIAMVLTRLVRMARSTLEHQQAA